MAIDIGAIIAARLIALATDAAVKRVLKDADSWGAKLPKADAKAIASELSAHVKNKDFKNYLNGPFAKMLNEKMGSVIGIPAQYEGYCVLSIEVIESAVAGRGRCASREEASLSTDDAGRSRGISAGNLERRTPINGVKEIRHRVRR